MMDEQIKHEERRVYCEGNYIGVILHSCDIEHREDDEITGVCHGLRINLMKSQYVIDANPFRQFKPIDFVITKTLSNNQKSITKIENVFLVEDSSYHIIDSYLVFENIGWVADNIVEDNPA